MVETKFKHTDIGLIPEDWEVKELGKLTSLMTNGFVGTAKIHYTESDKGVTYIQGFNVLENSFDYTGIKKVTLNFHSEHLRSALKYRDLLTIQTGDVGLTTFVPKELEGANCHALIISRFKEQNVVSKYVSFYLNSKTGRKRLKDIETGTTMKHINVGDFQYFQIPLPPLPEQQAIAEVLSDNDVWVESLEKLIAKKQQIKQGAMQKLLTPKDDWEVKLLGEVADFFKGKGLPKNNIDSNGNIKCIHYGELFTKHKEIIKKITNKTFNFSSSFLSKENDVLMPTSDVTPRGLATASCIKEEGVLLGGDILVIRFKKEIEGSYFSYFVSNNKEDILKLVSGSTVYHLYGSELSSLIFKYPKSKSEQTHIVTILSDMDTEIEALKQKLAKAKQIKQGLMQELLTGKIRLLQKTSDEQSQPAKKHNDHFNDAVLIGALASCFASEQYPMTRFKYTKVSYLLKRYKEEQTAGYLKKAAGPYKPQTRYGGAEKIALTRKYIASKKSEYKGKHYEGFVSSENVQEAIDYFKKWYSEDALQWIDRFKFETNDNLELWATVDMAIQDLKNENKFVSVDAIKQVIKNNKEWKDKLKRAIFSDENIAKAIIRLETLYTTV